MKKTQMCMSVIASGARQSIFSFTSKRIASTASILAVILGLCFFLTACDNKQEANSNEKPTVKIGAILPLTGNNAVMGQASMEGMLLALKEKNKADLHYNYELVFEDNQMKPAQSVSIATRLINIDKVDVIASFLSGNCYPLIPITEKAEILHLCSAWDDTDADRKSPNTFFQTTSWNAINNKYLQVFKQKGIKRIALLYQNFGSNAHFSQKLADLLNANEIETVVEGFNPGEKSFSTLLTKLKIKDFEYFWFFGLPPESDILIKDMHLAGINNDHIFSIGADTGKNFELYKDITFYGNTLGSSAFITKLEKNNIINQGTVSVNYDFVNLVINAYEKLAVKNAKPKIKDILKYINTLGEYDCASIKCKVQNNGFIVNPVSHREIVDGRIEVVEE